MVVLPTTYSVFSQHWFILCEAILQSRKEALQMAKTSRTESNLFVMAHGTYLRNKSYVNTINKYMPSSEKKDGDIPVMKVSVSA